ncbi:AAA family ATPase [Williamsia sp. M5A3_1d]
MIFGVGGAAIAVAEQPDYTADSLTYVAVAPAQAGDTFGDYVGLLDSQQRAVTFARLITSGMVAGIVHEAIGGERSTDEIRGSLGADARAGTLLITVMANDRSPVMAARLANEGARALISVVARLSGASNGPDDSGRLRLVQQAQVPPTRAGPPLSLWVAVSALIGGGITAVIDHLARRGNRRIESTADVEAITDGLVVDIASRGRGDLRSVAGFAGDDSSQAEAFRRLRLAVSFQEGSGARSVVAVAGSQGDEGVSTAAIFLAAAFADAGFRALLIDADVRAKEADSAEWDVGLTDWFGTTTPIEDYVQATAVSRLYVLASGRPASAASALLSSAEVKLSLTHLRDLFDVIVVDCPPLSGFAASRGLIDSADCFVLVARAGRTKRAAFAEAYATLRAAGRSVPGVVLGEF